MYSISGCLLGCWVVVSLLQLSGCRDTCDLILHHYLKNTDTTSNTEDTWWGGGWRWWVELGGCRDTCDGEREQPPLPAQSCSRPPTSHICPKVPPVQQKDFWALGGIKDVWLFVLQWGGGVDSFKGLGRSDRGRVVGHTTIYPIQLAPASKTSDCESLQVVILKVNQRLLLWSEEACVS